MAPAQEIARAHSVSGDIASGTFLHFFDDPISDLSIAIQKHHTHARGLHRSIGLARLEINDACPE